MKADIRPEPRFVVDALISGDGFVIVDRWWEFKMTGPYPKNMRPLAERRCAEFNADHSAANFEKVEAAAKRPLGKAW